jgi:hypothetical protein
MTYNTGYFRVENKANKFFIILICLFINIFTVFCQREKTIDLPLIDISSNIYTMEKISLSQFNCNIHYIPLEANSNSLLLWTYMNLVDFSDKYILYSDGKLCMLYDNEGHFIRQIGSRGRGPGEYTGINSVILKNSRILVHDFYTDDIIEYKLDGTFQNRFKSGFTANGKQRLEDVIMLNDSMIFGNVENRTGKEENKALIITTSGDIKHYYKNYIIFTLESGVNHAKAPGKAIYYKYKNKIFFKEFLNDTLFILNTKYTLDPVFAFNLGKYTETLSDRGKSWSQIDLSSFINIDKIFPTENYLILVCNFNKYFPAKRLTPEKLTLPGMEDYTQWYNSKKVLGVYDQRSGNLIFSEPTSTDNHLFTTGFYNDIDAGPRFMPDMLVNDSTMVMKIRPDHFMEHIESNDFKTTNPLIPGRKEGLKYFADSLKKAGFDNPVLMFVTFKNNRSKG